MEIELPEDPYDMSGKYIYPNHATVGILSFHAGYSKKIKNSICHEELNKVYEDAFKVFHSKKSKGGDGAFRCEMIHPKDLCSEMIPTFNRNNKDQAAIYKDAVKKIRQIILELCKVPKHIKNNHNSVKDNNVMKNIHGSFEGILNIRNLLVWALKVPMVVKTNNERLDSILKESGVEGIIAVLTDHFIFTGSVDYPAMVKTIVEEYRKETKKKSLKEFVKALMVHKLSPIAIINESYGSSHENPFLVTQSMMSDYIHAQIMKGIHLMLVMCTTLFATCTLLISMNMCKHTIETICYPYSIFDTDLSILIMKLKNQEPPTDDNVLKMIAAIQQFIVTAINSKKYSLIDIKPINGIKESRFNALINPLLFTPEQEDNEIIYLEMVNVQPTTLFKALSMNVNGHKNSFVITNLQKDVKYLKIPNQRKKKPSLLQVACNHEPYVTDAWIQVMAKVHEPKVKENLQKTIQKTTLANNKCVILRHCLIWDPIHYNAVKTISSRLGPVLKEHIFSLTPLLTNSLLSNMEIVNDSEDVKFEKKNLLLHTTTNFLSNPLLTMNFLDKKYMHDVDVERHCKMFLNSPNALHAAIASNEFTTSIIPIKHNLMKESGWVSQLTKDQINFHKKYTSSSMRMYWKKSQCENISKITSDIVISNEKQAKVMESINSIQEHVVFTLTQFFKTTKRSPYVQDEASVILSKINSFEIKHSTCSDKMAANIHQVMQTQVIQMLNINCEKVLTKIVANHYSLFNYQPNLTFVHYIKLLMSVPTYRSFKEKQLILKLLISRFYNIEANVQKKIQKALEDITACSSSNTITTTTPMANTKWVIYNNKIYVQSLSPAY